MWLGTYERDYPRGRVLIDGPAGGRASRSSSAIGRSGSASATRPARSCGPSPWRGRSGASPARGVRWRSRARASRASTAIVAGYPAQPDALPAWCVARARRVPLVVDMMISLADTLGGDRGRAGRLTASALAGVDRATVRAADLVVADTAAGADWLAERFGVPRARVTVVPVGAEPARFPPAAAAGRPSQRPLLRQARPAARGRHGARGGAAARGAAGAADRRRAARRLAGGRARARPAAGADLGALGALRVARRRGRPGRHLPWASSARAPRPHGWCRTRCGRRWPPAARW